MSDVIMSSRITRRRNVRNGVLVVLGLFVTVFVFTFLIQLNRKSEMEVEAASLDGFDAGYIISDWQMGNYNSMSEAEIQNFLTSKNSCGNRDYDYYLRLSRNSGYQWHWKDDHFVCLSEELFGDGETIGWGDTAAHILWQTAQDYRINPQALIVLLQKETGLITDPIPNNGDYRKATGYGCPDTAPCSSEYYGFKNQVRRAAALFRTVLDGGWTNYPLGENYIQYNPNSDCGGSVVNVRSLATSALYRYTPYQPNQGAIDAGYGTAYCGAYGNRNFYLYFQDWFGGITNNYEEKLGRTIPDGKYQITLKNNSYKSLDIRGGIYDGMSEEKVILYNVKNKGADNQTFELRFNEQSGFYNIYNGASGLHIGVNGDAVVVSRGIDSCDKKWNIERIDVNYYRVKSSCNGKYLSVINDEVVLKTEAKDALVFKMFEISDDTKTLKDGTYQIVTALGDYAIDIKGGVNEKTTQGEIELWDRKKSNYKADNQWFDVKYNSETGYYTIINHTAEVSLDVYNGNSENGTKIIAWSQNNNCNQQWMLREKNGGYEIISLCTGRAIDVPNSKVGNGQTVSIYTLHGDKNQIWNFEPVDVDRKETLEDGVYTINSFSKPEMVVDISGGVDKNQKNGELITYKKKSSNNGNQLFKFKKIKDNTYYIYNPESNLYLDVYNSGTDDGTKVIMWPYNGNCNQEWKITENSEGYYTILSSCSNKVLDISGGKIELVAPIIIYSSHNGINQKWTFERAG